MTAIVFSNPRSVELARKILANPHLYSAAAVAWAREQDATSR